jgi:hypothetical protein
MARFDIASTIINDALVELGAVSTEEGDVYGSSEVDVVQMRAFLKALGRDLARAHQWADLQKTHSFTTVDGTASYDLPDDFYKPLPSTTWNRTTEEKLLGPTAAQGWQMLKSTSAVNGITYWWRRIGNKIHLHPTPTADELIVFEYQSLYWVQPFGETEPTTETPSANTDTPWFDARLLVAGLKLKWRTAKRMDTAAEENEYNLALAVALGGDSGAPDLCLTGQSGVRLLTDANLPDTGYGP